jgi:hypothetical protein
LPMIRDVHRFLCGREGKGKLVSNMRSSLGMKMDRESRRD